MEASRLVKGKDYVWMHKEGKVTMVDKVTYKHETVNKYVFSRGEEDVELTYLLVRLCITEFKNESNRV